MYWQKQFDRPNKDEEVENKVKEIFELHKGNYGYRRVEKDLRAEGLIVNSKKVRRIMKKLDLKCVSFTRKSRKLNTYRGTVGTIAENLINRRFDTCIPHQKITTDTSEFKYYEIDSKGKLVIKKAYLDPFLDMFNREIISFSISKKPSAESISKALKEAIDKTSECKYRRTFRSDQGWAYQMKSYSKTLKDNRIFQSMSRKGNCLDNSPMENFFGVMKQEMYYGKIYNSFEELELAINEYIYYYNHKRIKSKLGWKSPVVYREMNQQKIA